MKAFRSESSSPWVQYYFWMRWSKCVLWAVFFTLLRLWWFIQNTEPGTPPNPRTHVLSAWFWKLWCTSFGEYGYMVSHYPLRIRWREMAFRGHCISAEASLSELSSIWKRSHWMHWSFAMRCSECFTHIWGKSTTPPWTWIQQVLQSLCHVVVRGFHWHCYAAGTCRGLPDHHLALDLVNATVYTVGGLTVKAKWHVLNIDILESLRVSGR